MTKFSTAASAPRARVSWVRLMPVALGLALLAAYSNSLRGPFIFDDPGSISRNSTLRHFSTALFPPRDSGITVSGRPILNLSFAINHAMGGDNVFVYHATNLAIHFFAALALFGLVRRTLELPRLREKFGALAPLAALSVAGIWALHPLTTESVTYTVQRAESLAGLFYLLALYAFVRVVIASASSWRWRIMLVVSCLLGMATKEVMVSAPIVLLFFDRAFVASSFRDAWRERGRLHLACFATWALLAACMISTGSRGGTVGFGGPVSSWDYLLTQCEALVTYLRLAFWPEQLVLDYGKFHLVSLTEVLPQALLLLGLLGVTIWACVRRPMVGFFGAVFFLVLAPSSSVIPLFLQPIAEHRIYLALAAVAALVVLGSFTRFGARAAIGWLVVGCVLGCMTYRRNHDYRSGEVIWRDAATKRPKNSRAWYCLGMELLSKPDFAEAETVLARSLELEPGNSEVMIGYANALAAAGKSDRAIDLYRGAIDQLPRDYPMSYEARHNLGVLLLNRGENAEAIEHLRVAVELRPAEADSHLSFGKVLAAAGQTDAAIKQYEAAIADAPTDPSPQVHLARLLVSLARIEDALPHFDRALTLNPGDARLRYLFANALLQSGRHDDAAKQYELVVQQLPDLADAHNELGIAYAELGQLEKARAEFTATLRLNPRDAGARQNLERLEAGGR